MFAGKSTWIFKNEPKIIATAAVGGPFEANGKIAADFDYLYEDQWMEQSSFEKAQQVMMEKAVNLTVKKLNLPLSTVDLFISGDLMNQITPTTYAAKTIGIPYLGLFSACATTTESLALAALIIENNYANYIISGSSSHNSAAERQFRFPTEYGGQKPPTAQWTVTGAGCALIAKQQTGVAITSATIGKIVDFGVKDPFNMGAAMAPAAVDTIITHLNDRNLDVDYYDLIITGDLGQIGHFSAFDLLQQKKYKINKHKFVDCGMSIYHPEQNVQAGASGAGCVAVVSYGHFIKKLFNKQLNKILIVATGALHSPLSIQQGDSIPGIAHAVSLEVRNDNS